ncbi:MULTISPECIES: FkbM family methyltransferase [unclassified Mesorhizobium]|uniref:FkbM family methyltransferase n=1 Tax=unclassified Mesorhizobium TaxID=325217 RepID=UPI000FCAACD7|nr:MULTISPECIES: FkbM family methyltransferase [unclassified Mesorhizobium]RUX34085.1 FkbM family methyltransferase [Mesorhizobium sp. M2A.F.Ca.ET.042.01.1.1]RWD62432.1 MAG: FkbM family methyltransferase [Mesorhizobium sp.]RWE79265.1 MAG: FkbM family methyltransferase [Mesorhizobium sp.]TIV32928.1 MAG: FkbM family methyltransferase [Mesorhizobium sp.]TIV61943.1 MAG: FkbM family methyltransferase [Mesorhizobium sp.]
MGEAIFSKSYAGDALSSWEIAHELSASVDGDALVVRDSIRYDWHLLRLYDPAFLYRKVRMRCVVKFLPTTTTSFYIHHYGGLDIAEIASDGTIVNRGVGTDLSANALADGAFEVDATFLSRHGSLSIGCSKNGGGVYAGTGLEQFALLSVLVETFDAYGELSRTPADERITLVDVGGQGGLQLKWMLRAEEITPVVFEPLASEAMAIRQTLSRIPGAQVVEKALANTSGPQKLFVTAGSFCSSLREPNFEILQHYPVGRVFEVVGTQQVECVRYDELFRAGVVPTPDVIKIDVQGFEYEVLLGFGHLLECCLAIELETHVVPIYRGQKLLGDIVDVLGDFGFALRQLTQVNHFDGDAVEFDALFTKRRDRIAALASPAKKKFEVIGEALGVPPYR